MYNSSTVMPLAVGTVLGQYEIRSSLGAGGMGEVYRAHDSRLNREVAIKVLPEPLTSDPDRLRRFEQEARAAAALNHPNILAVYQMATQDGISYLVSELLEGETLRERLAHGSPSFRKAVDYAVQTAHGLAVAHEKGIVHRDLKPDNLFVTKDGRVKILDFGLAKVAESKIDTEATLTQGTDPGMVMGTVGYMSPEQVRGKTADHRSDIFAFGTVLYELVTGKPTFRKPTSADTMAAILKEEPASISQLAPSTPPGLQRIIHRCLEKNPEQRFQSASDLAFALEALSDSAIMPLSGAHAPESKSSVRLRSAIVAGALVIALAATVLTYVWMKPQSVPRLSNYVQLTHDGGPKAMVGTDGSRLLLYLAVSDYHGMAEMTISGGEPKRLPILPSPNMSPVDLSPDGSELLVVDGQGVPAKGPFWSVPVLGGSPRRLGDAEGSDAAWSADGKMLVYTSGGNVFVAKSDGSESRKVVAMNDPAVVFDPVWSPDGTHLRFAAEERLGQPNNVLWEVSVDGTNLHRLLDGRTGPAFFGCCGGWTPDGQYFTFRSRGQIWALPRGGNLLRSEPKPIQLTSNPLSLGRSVFSRDGKKLFVVGRTARGELMRYVSKSGQLEPFLGGISAEYAAFSKDGQWVAYVSFPQGTLWRSKVDGSERLELTYPPDHALMPRWSPDGKKVAFYETFPDKPTHMFEVSSDGGTPKQLLPEDPNPQQDPNWSPDGTKIIFGGTPNDPASAVRILDLVTHQLTTLPESHGLFSPRWSPSGRYVPAISADSKRLLLFDFENQKWREIFKGTIGWLNWSKNGQYLQVLDVNGAGAVLEIRLSDGKTERIVDLKNFIFAGRYGSSLAVAPDDSPLLLRNAGTEDVYALDWEEP